MLKSILTPVLVVTAFGVLYTVTTILYGLFNNKK